MGHPQPDTKILVLNCGSSSIKYQLYQMPEHKVLCGGLLDRLGQPTQSGRELKDVAELGAVGHRVVHGGEEFSGSVLITPEVIDSIERFAELAPLHNPSNLAGIRAVAKLLPGLPQVACFDTVFHATLPKVAYLYALPYEVYEKHRVRRYGFHGTSHRYVARRAAQLLGKHKYEINCITAHLGNGCSVAAVRDGHSVDTSMGLTPLEGLIMGTRSGDFDPAVIFHLERLGYQAPCFRQPSAAMSRPDWPSTCSAIGSRNTWGLIWRCWAGWMLWCLPAGSARTCLWCGPRPARDWNPWG